MNGKMQIGFTQRPQLMWLESAAGLLLAGNTRPQIKAELTDLLKNQLSVLLRRRSNLRSSLEAASHGGRGASSTPGPRTPWRARYRAPCDPNRFEVFRQGDDMDTLAFMRNGNL
jgi:hypothetical protein